MYSSFMDQQSTSAKVCKMLACLNYVEWYEDNKIIKEVEKSQQFLESIIIVSTEA